MKNSFIFISGVCLILCSCANFDVPEIDSVECKNCETIIRTESEAMKIAAMATVRDCLKTRNSDLKTVSCVVPITSGNTRAAGQGNSAINLYNSLSGIASDINKRVAYVRGEDKIFALQLGVEWKLQWIFSCKRIRSRQCI